MEVWREYKRDRKSKDTFLETFRSLKEIPNGFYKSRFIFAQCVLIFCWCNLYRNNRRGWCKSNETNIFLHSVSKIYDYAFMCLHTQSTHFDNSKMVNWVNLVQKLTKIQGKILRFKLWKILVFVKKS